MKSATVIEWVGDERTTVHCARSPIISIEEGPAEFATILVCHPIAGSVSATPQSLLEDLEAECKTKGLPLSVAHRLMENLKKGAV